MPRIPDVTPGDEMEFANIGESPAILIERNVLAFFLLDSPVWFAARAIKADDEVSWSAGVEVFENFERGLLAPNVVHHCFHGCFVDRGLLKKRLLALFFCRGRASSETPHREVL